MIEAGSTPCAASAARSPSAGTSVFQAACRRLSARVIIVPAPCSVLMNFGRIGSSRGSHRLVCSAHTRSEEHTSELQSLMRISYAVFCLKKKKKQNQNHRLLHTRHHTSTEGSYHITRT